MHCAAFTIDVDIMDGLVEQGREASQFDLNQN
jgi:hypothetical protein